MSNLPFDFDTTRTEVSDAAYAAIGRALAFATRFEANCRALAAVIGLREAMMTRDASKGESVEDVFERITKMVEVFSCSLRNSVAKISDADRVVCVLAHLETREPLPTVAAFEEFPEKVVRWVCDVEE